MILDGIKIKNEILDLIKEEVSKLPVKLKLVVIQIGNKDDDNIYIKQKYKMCNYVGYDFEHIKLDNSVSTDDVIKVIDKLNKDNNVTGIMVQLPLPNGIDTDRVRNSISPYKDVDGLTDFNRCKLFQNSNGLFPCTATGIMELLSRYNICVCGKNVVIVGRSNLVSKPLSMMLLNNGATVTMCHSKTNNLLEYTKKADILIVAIGKPKFITRDMISDNVVVVDVGINKIDDGICGDVDFNSVLDKVKYITPVPGGIGPMTIALLAKNILNAYNLGKNIDLSSKL